MLWYTVVMLEMMKGPKALSNLLGIPIFNRKIKESLHADARAFLIMLSWLLNHDPKYDKLLKSKIITLTILIMIKMLIHQVIYTSDLYPKKC